jgi:hypothetical protein
MLLLGAFAGCSTTLEPKLVPAPLANFDLVDPLKVDKAQYEKDYADCAALGNQEGGDIGRAAAGALGNVADKASFGLLGNGGASKNADRVTVLKRCLTGRGYNVLR